MQTNKMKHIKAAICDDDPFYASELKNKIETILSASKYGVDFEIAVYPSAEELMEHFSVDVRICFLDICMKNGNGIDCGIRLKQLFPEVILVFVTSFIDFSLDGYKANAFRYILKPDIDRLLPDCIADIFQKIKLEDATLTISAMGSDVTLKASSILYVESLLHTQRVHLLDGRILECHGRLGDFEKRLLELRFIKSHKSYLVNFRYIQRLHKYNFILQDGQEIPIARNNYPAVKKAYLTLLGD